MTKWTPELSQGGEPLYLAIAKALVTDVEDGQLGPGDRLPTQRDLARQLDVSIGTVTRAYVEAERRGVIRGEIGRGTFVRDLGAEGSNRWLERDVAGGLIDLSVSYPIDSEAPDLADALNTIASRSDVSRLLRYQSSHTNFRYVEAGVAWLEKSGLSADPDGVVITAGAQHAISVVLSAITKPGDVVLTDDLTYPGLIASAQHQHLRLHGVAMDELGLIPEALQAACRQRRAPVLYCMPTIHNPTTAIMTSERRERIAEIAAEHDLLIIEDEPVRLLRPDAPAPLAALAPERSFFIASTSKVVGGGLRVAYVAAPLFAREQLRHGVWSTVWSTAPLALEVITQWIGDGTAEAAAVRKRLEAQARQDLAREILTGLEYQSQPESYFIWLELPAGWPSAEFANEARRRGVAVTPSGTFAADPAQLHKAVRVCLSAAEDRKQLIRGLNVLAEMLCCRECCPSALV